METQTNIFIIIYRVTERLSVGIFGKINKTPKLSSFIYQNDDNKNNSFENILTPLRKVFSSKNNSYYFNWKKNS